MAPDRPQPSLAACGAGSWRQPERRVPIGDQDKRVGGDPVVPAEYAFDEAEYATGITAGEQGSTIANQVTITAKNAAISRKNSTM
jgi:hypothetical protein